MIFYWHNWYNVAMSGIGGIVYPDLFQVSDMVKPILQTLKKEAPHDLYTHGTVQLGSCQEKLTFNQRKNLFVAFDGVLYNQQALKETLINKGYHFTLDTAAEIIVNGYDLWDKELFKLLDGEFAFALFDTLDQRLMIVRDRIGKKNVYWYHSTQYFIFSSQLKGVLATGAVPQTPAPDALAAYFYFGYLPQDLTPIQNVSKLLPGHYLQYVVGGGKTIESYWSYSAYFKDPIHKHKNTIAKELDGKMQAAVNKRVAQQGEQPVGCLISGGLGSASVAYYVEKARSGHVNAFTVGFSRENNEDIEAAQWVADAIGIPQQVKMVEPATFLDDLVPIIWHLDEPLADPNIIATWELARLAADGGMDHVYSGMGSDELLAGHTRYTVKEQKISLLAKLFYLPMPLIARYTTPLLAKIHKPTAYRLLKASRTNPWQFEYLNHNSLLPNKNIGHLSPKLAGLFDPEVFLHKFHHIQRIESTVASLLYLDVKTRLVDCFIQQYERLTQAHGLNWHTPFLDQQLVEYLAKIPEPQRLLESETAPFLKVAMAKVFPPRFINRPKVSRPHFLSSWIGTPAITELLPLLKRGTLVETGFVDEEWLNSRIKSPDKAAKEFRLLWAILVLELWFRLFINRPISSVPPSLSAKALLHET